MPPSIIPSGPKGSCSSIKCVHCWIELEYIPPSSSSGSSEAYLIQCHACTKTFSPSVSAGGSTQSAKSSAKKAGGGRRIGSNERPLETEYYEVLGVPTNAQPAEIKSAYRRMALRMHPDKNPNDPMAEEKFKTLAVAYNTLCDPALRKKYNEFGKQQDGEQGFVDPEAVFSTLFGGERFLDIIGTISLAQEMKSALQKDSEEVDNGVGSQLVSRSNPPPPEAENGSKQALTAEQKAKKEEAARAEALERKRVREARVAHLADKLKTRLYLYTEQAEEELDKPVMNSVKMIWEIEKDSLCDESFGPELLRTVGQTYVAKARRYLTATANGAWGGGVALVGGWIHSAKSTAHVFSETVGAVRAAYDVKAVFDELAKAEAEGGPAMSDERKKQLEEEAARKGLRALFKGAKLEVESVIRDVCDRVLEEPGVSRVKLRKRAVALEILGSTFETAQNKAGDDLLAELETGFNKVDPKQKASSSSTPAK